MLCVICDALACRFTKRNAPPWVFFTFFKFCKWYQNALSITYIFLDSKISPIYVMCSQNVSSKLKKVIKKVFFKKKKKKTSPEACT